MITLLENGCSSGRGNLGKIPHILVWGSFWRKQQYFAKLYVLHWWSHWYKYM